MNLLVTAPSWLAVLLVLCLAAAAIEDARRLRISNLTSLAVLAGALAAMAIVGPSLDLWQNFAAFAAILVLGTVAFGAGLMGGGDVKLFAALALWVDLRGAFWLISAIFVAGGLIALVYIAVRAIRGSGRGKRKQNRIPYGLAIAGGAAVLLLLVRPELHEPERPPPPFKIVRPA